MTAEMHVLLSIQIILLLGTDYVDGIYKQQYYFNALVGRWVYVLF